MQIYLYAHDSELMARWQAALHSDAYCCDCFVDALTHAPEAVLIVHWTALDQSQKQQLLEQRAPGPLVALVDSPEPTEGEWLLSRGVGGYANTYLQPDLLPEVVATVMRGDIWAGAEMMQGMLKRLLSRQGPVTNPSHDWHLSAREQQVLGQLVLGLGNKQIARQLGITERTIKAHVSSILEKSGVHDRIELILKLGGQRPSDMKKTGAGI